jgi:Na+/H+ antiporter NhaD/arsenite permease-like protein
MIAGLIMTAALVILVFVLTYIGMAVGRLPWFQVDRTGIALFGIIALLVIQPWRADKLGAYIDFPTLALLFALMIISAQFVTAGAYDLCVDWIVNRTANPATLLALTVAVCGGMSAILANDVVAFTMAPLLVAGAQSRRLDPRPFLIALAAASNAGSAATLIGNPQNILIGESGGNGELSFQTFLLVCGLPALVSLAAVFAVIWFLWHDRIGSTVLAATREVPEVPRHPYDRNQAIKGLVAVALLLGLFATPLPRDIGGLVIAAILLASRKFTSRTMIAAIDWPLLLLFVCLFAIAGSLTDTFDTGALVSSLEQYGLLPNNLAILAPLTLVMSNTIGNVPSVILLLQIWRGLPDGPLYGLALLSTLAGNLLLVGSLANIIVVERAATFGVRLSFGDYARAGIPITILSMGFAVIWLAWTGWLPWLPMAPAGN